MEEQRILSIILDSQAIAVLTGILTGMLISLIPAWIKRKDERKDLVNVISSELSNAYIHLNYFTIPNNKNLPNTIKVHHQEQYLVDAVANIHARIYESNLANLHKIDEEQYDEIINTYGYIYQLKRYSAILKEEMELSVITDENKEKRKHKIKAYEEAVVKSKTLTYNSIVNTLNALDEKKAQKLIEKHSSETGEFLKIEPFNE